MKKIVMLLTMAAVSVAAQAAIQITEWMYGGEGAEFVEFTNTGSGAIDLTGWSYDDDSRAAGVFDLSGFGIVDAGESVIITEGDAGDFITSWNLTGVQVLGGYTNNLGRNDEINLFDAFNALVDRLTFGDQNIAGTIRTNGISGNIPGAYLGVNDVSKAVLSYVGDIYGSYASSNGDLGNPGSYVVPEPATLALLGLGGLLFVRRP